MFADWLTGRDASENERLYIRHIAQRTGATKPLSTYLPSARELFKSMKARGFVGAPVPVNRDWQLLDGAHRTSLASILAVPLLVERFDTDHLWPAWDEDWFASRMPDALPQLLHDLAAYTTGDEIHGEA